MSYTKTNWQNDVTPANQTNMNHIENGLGDIDRRVTNMENRPVSAGNVRTTDRNNYETIVNEESIWLEDLSGNTIAPRTLMENVQNRQGVPIKIALDSEFVNKRGDSLNGPLTVLNPNAPQIKTVMSDSRVDVSSGMTAADKVYMDNSEGFVVENTYAGTKKIDISPRYGVRFNSYNSVNSLTNETGNTSPVTSLLPKEGGILATKSSVNELKDSLVNQKQQQKDLEFLGWSVPSECPIQNYVDVNGDFHQRVGRVDLGSLNWQYDAGTVAFFTNDIRTLAKVTSENVLANIYCGKYVTDKASIVYSANHKDKTIGYGFSNGFVMVCDFAYNNATTFKTAMSGIYLYYELATEVVIKNGKEAVSELKDSLSDKTGTLTSSQGHTVSDSSVVKSGNVVNINFAITLKSDVGTWTTIGMIPEGFRPKSVQYVMVNNIHAGQVIMVAFNPNGAIQSCNKTIANGNSCFGSCSYII